MTTYTKQIFEAVFLSFVLKYNLAHHTSEYINIWAWIVEGIFQFAMITWSQIFLFSLSSGVTILAPQLGWHHKFEI